MKAKKLHIDEWHVCIISFIRSVLALTLALVLMVLALSRSLIHVNYFVTVTWTSLRSTVKLSYTEEKLWNGLDEAAASSSVVFFRRICLYLTATRNSRGGSSYQLARATEQPTNSINVTHTHELHATASGKRNWNRRCVRGCTRATVAGISSLARFPSKINHTSYRLSAIAIRCLSWNTHALLLNCVRIRPVFFMFDF